MIKALAMSIAEVVAQVGETDQIFLSAPTPQLAIRRAQLRLQLVAMSQHQSEQLYFLGEAAVILEIANSEVEDQATHVLLAAQLAAVYLQFNQVTPQQRYLTVAGQILRPHSNSACPAIFLALARMDAAQHQVALLKHWLRRWLKVANQQSDIDSFDIEALRSAPEFKDYQSEIWFKQCVVEAENLLRLLLDPITSVHS
jgi:hypothetical protein